MRLVLIALLLGLGDDASSRAAPIPPGGSQVNIVYGMYSGLGLLLDVKRPIKPNGTAVLHIPGSAFQAPLVWGAPQLKDSARRDVIERPLLDAGFTVFTINHRAAPRFRYPAAVQDAQRASRFIRANAKSFGVRSDRLAVIGLSSGGNLAAMLATLGEGSDDESAKSPVRRPNCVVAAMAPLELKSLGLNGDGVGFIVSYIGHPPDYSQTEGPERQSFDADYKAASPITHVSAGTSPMLLLHGDQDTLVPIDQSQRFAAALKRAGGKVELVQMRGVGHFVTHDYAAQSVKWLTECMGRRA